MRRYMMMTNLGSRSGRLSRGCVAATGFAVALLLAPSLVYGFPVHLQTYAESSPMAPFDPTLERPGWERVRLADPGLERGFGADGSDLWDHGIASDGIGGEGPGLRKPGVIGGVQPIPEPSSLLLFGAGIFALAIGVRGRVS
ncbi:MAG: PEP-CTERM sorting domain-containing protein [Candidatus Eisenbacteria bacterium]|nr:PEP-CTERM sorting domain-containing protein [Candidatus Latescibacterota bacterium]MBD3301247.1 PEP-CTERM sorting domain-containing protein [Candidatus Eisenbacteria bacterium]